MVTVAGASSELGAKLPSQQLWQPIHVFLMVLNFIHSFSLRGKENKVIEQSQKGEILNLLKLSQWLKLKLYPTFCMLFYFDPVFKLVSYFLSHESRKLHCSTHPILLLTGHKSLMMEGKPWAVTSW